MRRRVLNDEAGGEVFTPLAFSDEEASLKKTWAKNIGKALSIRSNDALRRKNPDLDLFLDDEISDISAATTENLWNRKVHFLMIQGLGIGSVEGLRSLLTFRQKVRKFPMHGGTKRFKDDSEIAAAFEQAWRPFQYDRANEEWRLLHSSAAAVYEKVASGTLCDEDELQRRNSSSK